MGGADPLNLLLPSLWDHNIHGVAKLAKKIPLKVRLHVKAINDLMPLEMIVMAGGSEFNC